MIRGVGGGGGVRPKAEKKIVSVGAISTFRHPLGDDIRKKIVQMWKAIQKYVSFTHFLVLEDFQELYYSL